jgi:hypothetical protein
MALELGGPDIPANIVPQYGQWQGGGEWRQIEKELAALHNGHYFVAWLYYNFASKDYAGQYHRCGQGEVFDWNHCYIPNRIEICILDSSSHHAAVAALAAALSAPSADEKAFSAVLETVYRLRLPDAPIPPVRFGDSFYQLEMPKEDRDYWLGQHVYEIIGGWIADYQKTSQTVEPVVSTGRSRRGAAKPAAPMLMNDITFTYSGANHLREALIEERLHDGSPMWDPAYLNETVTPAFCVNARFKDLPRRTFTQLQKTQATFPYTPRKPGDS